MKAAKHVLTTIFFAALSPLYLLYILVLVVLSPLGLALAKPFRRTKSAHSFTEYADREFEYSLNEMFSFSGFKRVLSTILFAVLSPLYIPYILFMVVVFMIGSLLPKRFRKNHGIRTA